MGLESGMEGLLEDLLGVAGPVFHGSPNHAGMDEIE